jgi:hypothetical protein
MTIKIMYIGVAAVWLIGCSHKNHSLGRERSRVERVSAHYVKLYGTYSSKTDTTILHGNIKTIYRSGTLVEAGKIRNGQKTGEWYVFNDSLDVVAILNYKNDSTRSVKQINNTDW